jgi:tripartite-type tricarboxylate transporter receptor subunit TctC
MTARLSRRRALAALAFVAAPAALRAQVAFPRRPITVVVPFAAGGIADLTVRALAPALAERLGQPVIVDNRPSAGAIVATEAVVRAAPDGHTLLLLSNANAVAVSLFRKLPYDVQRDLAPVAGIGAFDLGLFVRAEAPERTLADFLARARTRPGAPTIGTISPGSTQHLAAELFKTAASIDALVVPYKASPAVLTALRGGEIDLAFEILGPMLPQVGAGAVRALAVTGARRNPALPEVPTVQEAGVEGYQVASWNALAAPAATPAAVIAKLNEAVRAALAQPALAQKLAALGVRAQATDGQAVRALMASEIARWGDVIRRAKIEPQ